MFGLFENEQVKRLKSHLLNLGALAKIDGHVDSSEVNFIVSIGIKNGLKPDEVRALLANSHSVKLMLPTNDSDRFDQLYDLVEMMLVDGVIDDSEMDFCIDMAEKLGFKKAVVGVLVRKITMGVKDGHKREDIKKEAHSFLNL
jgi:uncharacterized membrane protein YebE (DUF533 family)